MLSPITVTPVFPITVTPAKAGVQEPVTDMDSRLRGNDACEP